MNNFETGEVVQIVGEKPSKHISRIGQRAKVLRRGVHGMYWLLLEDGKELVWNGIWIKKIEKRNK